MASKCGHCGAALDIQRSRRTPKYCSGRCRTAACRARQAQQLPAELRERDRWVLWNARKVPMQLDGTPASSTDPSTWASHRAVRGHGGRVGFVLGAGIGCIDLDHCLIDGAPTAAAAEFLATLPPTFIEISPSGDGLHVWGLLPEARGSRTVAGGLSIETYSVGRYITVTGNLFAGSVPRLADLSCISAR